MSDLPEIFSMLRDGKDVAAEDLLPLVYEELRKLASHRISREQTGVTLQPTALVHEAWLRLVGKGDPGWKSRAQFFAAAAEAMRRILVERARRKRTEKRGGGQELLNLDEVEIAAAVTEEELLSLHEVLDRFALQYPARADLVRLRYFIGMSFEEAAGVLGASVSTLKRDWAFSKAWLYREIEMLNSTASDSPQ